MQTGKSLVWPIGQFPGILGYMRRALHWWVSNFAKRVKAFLMFWRIEFFCRAAGGYHGHWSVWVLLIHVLSVFPFYTISLVNPSPESRPGFPGCWHSSSPPPSPPSAPPQCPPPSPWGSPSRNTSETLALIIILSRKYYILEISDNFCPSFCFEF